MSALNIKDILSDASKIASLNPKCQELHITRTFSHKKILKILEKCKKDKHITLLNLLTIALEKAKSIITIKRHKIILEKQGRPIS
jgi:hypothetical protein